jgi:hypothetical protein
MKTPMKSWNAALAAALLTLTPGLRALHASSHMDAPLITLDPAANETDVYAFRTNEPTSTGGTTEYLTVSLAVYPFEEPGIGPNNFQFDPNVVYKILVSTGTDMAIGHPTIAYVFQFSTTYKDTDTIAQAFLGTITSVSDSNQNLVQSYTVKKYVFQTGTETVLFSGNLVPPNNQGLVTPYYNQDNNGNNRAREGVGAYDQLDSYTTETIYPAARGTGGYEVFCGQRSDGFYADIQSIFDLDFGFSGPDKPHNSQA